MHRLICLLALVALAALAPAAAAKEIQQVKACGADECVTLTGSAAQGLEEGGPLGDPPAAPAAFYTLELTVVVDDQGATDTFTTTYVPSAGALRGISGPWMTLAGTDKRRYDRAVEGLTPFPASALTGLEEAGLPEVIVDEVMLPPAQAAEDGFPSSAALAALAVLAVLLLTAFALTRAARARTGRASARPAA